jgi:mono/diheme cytochrome c family protein
MQSKQFYFSLVIYFSFLLSSCRKDKYVEPICFDTDVQPILSAKCGMSGCHNSVDKADNLVLTSYDGFLNSDEKDDIEKVLKKGEMPPPSYPKLTDEEYKIIKKWITSGYSRGECNVNSTCDTNQTITYNNAIKSIMDAYCAGCHNASSPAGGFALDTYNGVVNCANSGRLVGSVEWQSGFSPMPKGGNKLNACDIAKIKKWIVTGKQQ